MARKEREPVHFGYLSRRLMECLPDVGFREDFIAPTIQALYAHSNTYFEKEDLQAGKIHFTGTASYNQLARHMKCDRETAKDRCEMVRDRWGILSWKRTKYGISYTVSYRGKDERCIPIEKDDPILSDEYPGCRCHGPYLRVQLGKVKLEDCWILKEIHESGVQVPISTEKQSGIQTPNSEIQSGVRPPISDSSQGSGASSQGFEPVEIGVGTAEIGVRTPPLSLSVLKETVEVAVAATNLSSKDQGDPETPTDNSQVKDQTSDTPSQGISISAVEESFQQKSTPRVAPPSDWDPTEIKKAAKEARERQLDKAFDDDLNLPDDVLKKYLPAGAKL